MRQTISLKQAMGVLLVFLCVTVGCKRGDTDIITASPANGPTVRSAIEKAQQMLDQNEDIDVILTTLEDQLKADPRVYDVEVESELGSVSMVFKDGETHCISLRDEEFDSEVILTSAGDMAYDSQSTRMKTDSAEEPPLQQQVPLGGVYQMPANNKALVANGYVYFHGKNGENPDPKVVLTDSTEKIKVMLEARGYKVTRPEDVRTADNVTIPVLPVAVFKELTKYGVILIETHGGRRKLEYPQEFWKSPNCGGAFSKYKLVTTEEVTMEKIQQYKADIFCGRLPFHDKVLQGANGPFQVFEVTPNFIRQYNTGNFPDNTLMMLNVCSSDKSEIGSSSLMKDIFFEKSGKGARFLGWSKEALVAAMGRVSLNLFQLMTASNEELTVKKLKALKKSTPPQGGYFTMLTRALEELDNKSYLTDPKTGAKLQLSLQGGEESQPDLILMPHPLYIQGPLDWIGGSLGILWMYNDSESQPTVKIGDTEVAVTTGGTDAWDLSSVPVGAYGDIVVRANDRTSIPRILHRWKTQIKVTSISSPEGFPFMKYEATLTMHARSTIGFINPWGVIQDSFRDSVWDDPPPAHFAAYWDLSASNVAWKIEGEGSDGELSYKYEGSGLKPLIEVTGDIQPGAIFTDESGTLVSLRVRAIVPFTMTIKALEAGETITQQDIPLSILVQKENISLADDWSVFPASFQSDVIPPLGSMAQISWNGFPAEPPFDKNTEPR